MGYLMSLSRYLDPTTPYCSTVCLCLNNSLTPHSAARGSDSLTHSLTHFVVECFHQTINYYTRHI
jgi:hypothetical protein